MNVTFKLSSNLATAPFGRCMQACWCVIVLSCKLCSYPRCPALNWSSSRCFNAGEGGGGCECSALISRPSALQRVLTFAFYALVFLMGRFGIAGLQLEQNIYAYCDSTVKAMTEGVHTIR